MPHISVPADMPGIRGLMSYRPDTALHINQIVEVLLQDAHTLSPGEHEIIATYVSAGNDCYYCSSIHGAIARAHLGEEASLVDQVVADPDSAPISPKLRALLKIAGAVRESGLNVTEEQVAAARAEGASDLEIHDAVLIAACFSMANRYVDGLGTSAPVDPEIFAKAGAFRAANGYLAPAPPMK